MARVSFAIEVREADGDPISGASVTLTIRPGGGAVTHWSAETGGTSSTATFPTDANGRAVRWVDSGSYNAAISKAGFTSVTRAFEAVRGDAVELIADNVVGTAQISEGAVTAPKLASNAITLAKIAAGQITESKLVDNAVSTRTVIASAVTNAKIADAAVDSGEILDRAVGTAEIQSDAVGSSELASLAVSTVKLVDNSVLRTHLAPLSITSIKLGPNSITEPAVVSAAVLPQHVANEVLPVGMLLIWAGANAPSPEWLIANGAAVSRTTYAALFAYLGTSFGAGNGSTTFNLPDMRGRTSVGVNTTNGATASLANDGVAQNVRGPKHGHGIGSVGISSDGNHGHFISGPGNPVSNNVAAGNGPDHAYGANIVSATTGGASHFHVIGGWTGNLEDPNSPPGGNGDALFHQVVNYLIKAL